MEYFTRAWALGDLSDEEFERVETRYNDLLGSLDESGPVRQFANTISLNDAYLDSLEYSDGEISLRLLTGDLQRGYWHTVIHYGGGSVVHGLEALERGIVVRPTEIWYDEFSTGSPRMAHRFLLVKPGTTEDRGEVHIEFDAFSFAETRAAGRVLA